MVSGNNQPCNVLQASGLFDSAAEITEFHLEDGRVFRLPTAMLTQRPKELITPGNYPGQAADSGEITTPVAEEHLTIDKRVVPTGTVRLHKSVQEFETVLHEPLAVRAYDVERVLLNQPVEMAPGTRQEGDTTIYPVVEEQLVLTKQLVLKEEIRVTRRDTERIDTQTVTLRREHIAVERDGVEPQTCSTE